MAYLSKWDVNVNKTVCSDSQFFLEMFEFETVHFLGSGLVTSRICNACAACWCSLRGHKLFETNLAALI